MSLLFAITCLLLFYMTTAVATVSSSYCGFPAGSGLEGTCARDAKTRVECEESYFVGATVCYWLVEEELCTSNAVLTNEDPYCFTVLDQETCDKAYFYGFRYCVWFETEAPSTSPSLVPSTSPSLEPSSAPSQAPSLLPTEYCGIPFLKDPWALPRQLCSDATNMVDCLRSFMETPVKCFWSSNKEQCTSEFVATGEDVICPIVTQAQVCNTVSHRLNRQCFWYEPRDPTVSPSVAPSAAPSASPSTPFPTRQPTRHPTKRPTPAPTKRLQLRPVPLPPSAVPMPPPTAPPTNDPSESPTTEPSASQSADPTTTPSKAPSPQPTTRPTAVPSAAPSPSPSQAPSSSPSQPPSHSPTALPSHTPSSSPTATPIEDLITVCRCTRETQCFDVVPLQQGDEFYLCFKTADPSKVVLDTLSSVKLGKNTLQQWIQRNETWAGETSFQVKTGGSILVVIDIRAVFFDKDLASSEEVQVDGTVIYNRTTSSSEMNSEEEGDSKKVSEQGVFSFQHVVAIKNTDNVNRVSNRDQDTNGLSNDASAAQEERQKKKKKFNLKLWTPIAVVLTILIALVVKLFVDMRRGKW